MITRLYNTEEDPALCSLIWGRNLSASNANEQIDEDGETTIVGSVAGATPTLYSAHNSFGAGGALGVGGSSSGSAESDIVIGSAAVNAAGGSSLRDDFFIANEVSICGRWLIPFSLLFSVAFPFNFHWWMKTANI